MPIIIWELRYLLYLLLVFSFEARKVPENHIVFPPGEKLKSNKTENVTELVTKQLPKTETRLNLQPNIKNETMIKPPKNETIIREEESTTIPNNVTMKISEEKMIVFKQSEEEDEINKLWNQKIITTTEGKKLDIGPRITLESLPRCKEGFKLIGEHCRKEA
ncbi:uncharacterized protein LOC111519063 [Drosophila willistoni]|uniref:uncharacterized protein LOC111519063 n=1 Tax=Drosophila willistoni TaxID=7260 RepID=UPI000C26D08C|nr:uncharacterized protein LOC111519063 [Drosophila willistoni]